MQLALPALTQCLFTSKQHLDLIALRLTNDWSFDASQAIRLPGAHREEIVRSVHVNSEVCLPLCGCISFIPALLTHSRRTVLFSRRARTGSLERGGCLRVEEVKVKGWSERKKKRGRGRKRRRRVRLMVGMMQVDLDLIEVYIAVTLVGRYPGFNGTVYIGPFLLCVVDKV